MKAWLAFWMDGKTRRSKTFSSKVFGFEEARLAAIDFLQGRKREAGCDVTLFSIETSTPPQTPGEKVDGSPDITCGSSTDVPPPSTSSSRTSLSSVSTGVIEIISS
jgi:hypothetical protein